MKWITRERPKIDRIACPWLIRRFVEAVAELRRRGYDARGLKGGIGAWHAIGGPTVPLDRTTYTRISPKSGYPFGFAPAATPTLGAYTRISPKPRYMRADAVRQQMIGMGA